MEEKQELQNLPKEAQSIPEEVQNLPEKAQNLSKEAQNRENLRIRKAEWIQEQIVRQRDAEDALFAQIQQEQKVLDELKMSMDQNMETTRQARKYNREFQENMNAQVYAMYGITTDKLQGMREYRNAYYQGCAFALFFLSMVLVALCGFLHGFQSEICLFMIAFSGIEGALLTRENRRGRLLNLCCKILYLLMFPLMMVIFVCYELKYPEYELFLPIFSIFGIAVLLIGTLSYFLYNPYREDRRVVEEAKDTIRTIEKTARKEVRKSRKSREKAEKRELKKSRRAAAWAERKRTLLSHFKRKKEVSEILKKEPEEKLGIPEKEPEEKIEILKEEKIEISEKEPEETAGI